jgi:hypothetical protein
MAAEERPFPEYAALTAAFGAVLAGFLVPGRRRLPERHSLHTVGSDPAVCV